MSTRNNLPPEIIELIVRRLPAKSLGRFKCVSKPWSSFISDPQFIKTHLFNINIHHHTKLILRSETTSLYSLDIDELSTNIDRGDISVAAKELRFTPYSMLWEEILGSCNGVVLAYDDFLKIYLINPTTREVFEIPVSPFALPIGDETHMSIVMYGFGYDSSTDDYKLVSISYWDTYNADVFVSIYSLRSNSWKRLQNSTYHHSHGYQNSGVLLNENLHWLTSTRPEYDLPTIVAFSLANEEFHEIELPYGIRRSISIHLCVLGGKLVIYGRQLGSHLWVMEEYGVGESWHVVNIHGVEINCVQPMCLIEGSNGDIVLGDEDRVTVYTKDEGRCRDVVIMDPPSWFDPGGTYIETLESFKRILTL